jgi:hypothetical protein
MWASSSSATTTGTQQIKANANTVMDSFDFNTSAKDRRKAKHDIIKIRREYEIQNEISINDINDKKVTTKSGVGCMILPKEKGKDMDINLQSISLNLNNGTCLMEKGDLKFTYKRRYAIIGENGVGTFIYNTVYYTLYYTILHYTIRTVILYIHFVCWLFFCLIVVVFLLLLLLLCIPSSILFPNSC